MDGFRAMARSERNQAMVFEPLADDPDRGRVVFYSLPSSVHERASHTVELSIIKQMLTLGNSIDLISTADVGQPTCTIGAIGQEPNASLIPDALVVNGADMLEAGYGAAFPTLIIQAAYKNDSLLGLRTKPVQRMQPKLTSVQVAIGIKIFAGPAHPLRRVAILCQCGLPDQEVEFGHDRHGAAGLLALAFPLAFIYAGVALPAALAGWT